MNTPLRNGRSRHWKIVTGAAIALAGAMALATGNPASALEDPTISIVTEAIHPAVGDQVELDVIGAGFSDLYGYSLTVAFDADRLRFVESDDAAGPAGFATYLSSSGVVTVIYTKLGTSLTTAGDFDLARLTFDVIAPGSAHASVTAAHFEDSTGATSALAEGPDISIGVAASPGTHPSPSPTADGTQPSPSAATSSAAAPAGSSSANGHLATTGADNAVIVPAVAGGVVLAILGAALVVTRRRRLH